jgi:hypothetical protein
VPLNKKNLLNLLALSLAYTIVIGIISISYFAKDEGTLGNNIILNFIADYLYYLSLPSFYLIHFLSKIGIDNFLYISIGIILNGLFYAITTLIIFNYVKRN